MYPRLCLLLLAAACVRTTPQPPSSPELPVAGCQELQTGNWVHASDPQYRYLAEDDGGTLTLAVSRVFDAGFSPRRFRIDAGYLTRVSSSPTDAGINEPSQVRIELQRTVSGFEGETIAVLQMPSGQQCEARFPTSVVDCGDGGLVLETQTAMVLGDGCQPPAKPQDVRIQQHRLVRPNAPF